MSCHLNHVDVDKAEDVERLLTLLYDRVNGGFSRTDLARIFIALGGGARGGGGGSDFSKI